jgi:hypothetical protein
MAPPRHRAEASCPDRKRGLVVAGLAAASSAEPPVGRALSDDVAAAVHSPGVLEGVQQLGASLLGLGLLCMNIVASNPCDIIERPRATTCPLKGLSADQPFLAVIPETHIGLFALRRFTRDSDCEHLFAHRQPETGRCLFPCRLFRLVTTPSRCQARGPEGCNKKRSTTSKTLVEQAHLVAEWRKDSRRRGFADVATRRPSGFSVRAGFQTDRKLGLR